jgi:hypothetical protein
MYDRNRRRLSGWFRRVQSDEAAPPVLAPTTWSTVDRTAPQALSGGNLIVTAANDAAATFQSGRSIVGIAAGEKKFFSLQVTILPTASNNVALGLANSTFAFTDFLGVNAHSLAMYFNTATTLVNNASIGTAIAWVLNSVFDQAVDRQNNRYWSRIGGGNWNNSPTANPATNTEGFDISGISGTVFPCYQLLGDAGGTGRVTANFGATAYTHAAPVGFSNIEG